MRCEIIFAFSRSRSDHVYSHEILFIEVYDVKVKIYERNKERAREINDKIGREKY